MLVGARDAVGCPRLDCLHPVLAGGRIARVTGQGAVLSFRRIAEGESLAVLANAGSTPTTVAMFPGEILLSS